MSIMVFDIETVADAAAGRHYHQFTDLDDEQVVQALRNLRRQESGHDFLPLHLHRIVCIAAVYQQDAQLKVAALGDANSSEAELISKFFEIIERKSPLLVSWNGSSFDLPVLHYRALLHGLSAPRYFEIGDHDPAFRYNNYLSRYHYRHMDIMDILANYQARAYAPLDQIASLLGLPGKMGMSGQAVQEYYAADRLEDIRNYCETDVLNTYLVFLRFQLLRGKLSYENYQLQSLQMHDWLQSQSHPHLQEFLNKWDEGQTWLSVTYGNPPTLTTS